ncbi:ATP-binding protein [Peristeroidobacter agariperforans]|uniref:ATP-binding protein n=1 Tax=Peristeroidobacter agariperforans TaxID=268404 RepID=UPI00101BA2DE|nr:ATP-binding protein [Peristeroidobacter agariperforans]
MMFLPRGVFGQLALVIALTLIGTALLAVLLGRELVTRPAASQMLRSMDGFAGVIEELDKHQPRARMQETLRKVGLQVSETPPEQSTEGVGPFMREIIDQARQRSDGQRVLRIGQHQGSEAIWFELNTTPPVWVSLGYPKAGERVRRFSVLLLAGSVLLVWLAAAYYARRLVMPLRQLAQAAPRISRGDPPPAMLAASSREVAELAQALSAASLEVRTAAEDRSMMLAGISHDLRTPLTRLQYAIELLPDTDPELREGIGRDIEEIDGILTQFIDYARDGRDEASEAVNLADICRNAATAASGAWTLFVPDIAPLHGRPMALLRAVSNLLVNAERHGAPPLRLYLTGTQGSWTIEVRDRGPGMSPKEADRVRQPFARGAKHGGSGLGLTIVDRVAHQHGGELRLLPNTPRGLCATLRLRGS